MKIDFDFPIAVFLGPSLALSEAKNVLPANYYPPVKQGDLYQLLNSPLEIIVIIDGLFDATTPIWHREILAVLESGKKVFGAASMGALRACELAPYGMRGHGKIFEWYRDGIIDGDDEVSLFHTHESLGFQKISEPLVNIRHNLSRAVSAKILTQAQNEELIDFSKALYFGDRSLAAVASKLSSQDPAFNELSIFLKDQYQDLKALDAMGLLRALADGKGTSQHLIIDELDTQALYAKEQYAEENWHQRDISCQDAMADIELLYRGVLKNGDEIVVHQECIRVLVENWDQYSSELREVSEFGFLKLCLKDAILSKVGNDTDQGVLIFENWQREQNIENLPRWLQENGMRIHECRREVLAGQSILNGLKNMVAAENSDIDKLKLFIVGLRDLPGNWVNSLIDIAFPSELNLAKIVLLNRWAGTRGYVMPTDWNCPSIQKWPYESSSQDQIKWLKKHHMQTVEFSKLYQQFMTAIWLMEMGPGYFGFNWNPIIEVFRQLQIKGRIQELI